MTDKSAIVATTPEQQQVLNKFLRTATPNSVRQWLADLPSGVNEQVTMLNGALKSLDELGLPPVQVYTTLEILRPAIYEKFEIMTQRFLGKSANFPQAVQDMLAKAMTLQSYLAACYDHIVFEAERQGASQAFIMGSAIHRAMADKSYLLLCYYQLYLPIPQQLWRQFHELFVIAQDHKLLSQSLADPVLFAGRTLNIKQVYLSAMMLGCSDTNHLALEKIAILGEAIKDWVSLLDITPVSDTNNPDQLVVNLDSGSPPQFRRTLPELIESRTAFIRLDRLIQKLQKVHTISVRVKDLEQRLDKTVLEQLINTWTVLRERNNERYQRGDSLISSFGLNAVHYHLTGGMALNDFIGPHEVAQQDPMGKAVLGKMPEDFRFHAYTSDDVQDEIHGEYPCQQVCVVNESTGGYCLEWPIAAMDVLYVGEIVALKEKTSSYWNVGEIVWMNKTPENTLRTGVCLISDQAIPLVAKVPASAGNRGEFLRSLLIPENKSLRRDKVTLLVPNVRLHMGERMHVIQEGRQQGIQLLQPYKENKAYSQFECAYLVLPDDT